MKSPIRTSKTAAPVIAAKKPSKLKTAAPEAASRIPPPHAKLAIANMPYNASDKRAINKSNAPKEPSEQQANLKKKQAAAQES